MRVTDSVYGTFDIQEPILVDLLRSEPIERLKRVRQFGIPEPYYHVPSFSRYEHSLGVMLLLQRLGATLLEQVAGLLHDASILAFSHIADWVFGHSESEDFHDSVHGAFLERNGIVRILERYEISVQVVADLEKFSLLERPIPELCADRVDYALRELRRTRPSSVISKYLSALSAHDGAIVFTSPAIAEAFATDFLELQRIHWGGREARIRYVLFVQLLTTALEKEIISKEDFWLDDEAVLAKLHTSGSGVIESILTELSNKPLRPEVVKRFARQAIHKKFRHVDPLVLLKGNALRLSEISPAFADSLQEARKINDQGGL